MKKNTKVDALFSDDLLFVNHLGKCISKEDDISAMKRGGVEITNIDTLSQDIRIVGDIAVAVSDSILELIIEGKSLSDHLMYTRIWQRFNDEWRLVGGQATPIV